MSSKDKTRQKLMESMRKTKAVSSGTKKDTDMSTKPRVNTPVKKKAKKTTTKKTTQQKVTAQTQNPVVDPYQSVRRVWPD